MSGPRRPGGRNPAPRAVALGCALALALPSGLAVAKVFHSRQQALALAFPEAERVTSRTFVLDDAQARAVEERARARLDTRLVTIHTGFQGGRALGHALIDVHTVRTQPEAFLFVVSPDGRLTALRLLAFHEPEEYSPPTRWLRQFEDRTLADRLRVSGDIDGISGATLTAHAVTSGARRALALTEVLMRGAEPER